MGAHPLGLPFSPAPFPRKLTLGVAYLQVLAMARSVRLARAPRGIPANPRGPYSDRRTSATLEIREGPGWVRRFGLPRRPGKLRLSCLVAELEWSRDALEGELVTEAPLFPSRAPGDTRLQILAKMGGTAMQPRPGKDPVFGVPSPDVPSLSAPARGSLPRGLHGLRS